ncbi:MAG: serine protease, partial [Marivita lacus]|nr:serine protease [Marivita lacus]
RDRLAGLYEIMQTLDIVPLDGPRERDSDSFTLTGQNASIVSHTEARLDGGAIKGFTLIWPAGDEERRSRILAAMQSSFAPIPGVLDPAVIAEDSQSVDLVAGLSIRKPKLTASGFFVDRQGRVVTTDSAVASCGRITLNSDYDAEIMATDPALGIAVLRATQPLAPNDVAQFRDGAPRLQSEIAVAGFSFGGVLPSATMTFGRLSDLRGLNGEDSLSRLAISTLDGDAGGPVLDDGGAVIGMLIPHDAEGRQLPDDVNFATNSASVQKVLSQAGVSPQLTTGLARLDPVDLTQKATAMTVLVSCWE